MAVEPEEPGIHAIAWLHGDRPKCLIVNLDARSKVLAVPADFPQAFRLAPEIGLEQLDITNGELLFEPFTTLLLTSGF